MLYELIILSFLMRSPTHGYQIAKILNDMMGPFTRLSNGQLYPLLTKLEVAGSIVVADDVSVTHGNRYRRTFKITPAGRERFHALMLDTTSNLGTYQEIFLHKLAALHFLPLDERLYLLDHYITFCQTHLFHKDHEMADLQREASHTPLLSTEQLNAYLRAMQHQRRQWELELENARVWREYELSQTTLAETREAPDQ
jgi:DNA-binding PadR family transcriptional regulator